MSALLRWLVLALPLVLGLERSASACMNATMSDTVAVAKLHEAEAALEEGDVVTARDLASEVYRIYAWTNREDPLFQRAARIESIAFVRDPAAEPAELDRAVEQLAQFTKAEAENEVRRAPATPALLADYGEALERVQKNEAAYAVLAPLADKDLIGSSYALAALSRAAKAKGDGARAELAMKRCETTAVNARMCRGDYPAKPFLRGRARDFALLGVTFAWFAGLRRFRKKPLWSEFRAPLFAGLIVAFGIAGFYLTNLRWPIAAGVVVLPVLLSTGWMQRGQWVRAVRRGQVKDFTIRVATPEDQAPTLSFLDGPRTTEVLEPAIGHPGYRDSARPPVLYRLEQNKISFGLALAGGLTFAVLAGIGLLLLTLTRG